MSECSQLRRRASRSQATRECDVQIKRQASIRRLRTIDHQRTPSKEVKMSTTAVLTGGTSGFGLIAAEDIATQRDTELLQGARRPSGTPGSIPLDLTTLDSVRLFAGALTDHLDTTPIDVLVFNAGIIRADVATRTVDGFETTFAVNHLAHYLLLRLLLPNLADGATIVMTTSGTHDPATKAGLLPPRHAHADLLAHPERDRDLDPRPRKAGEQAYSASKLCTVLTVRALAESPEATVRGLTAIAYDPGQVFGTKLAQHLPRQMRWAWAVLGTPLGWPLRRFNGTLNTQEAAGRALADLVLGRQAPPAGRTYAALRHGRLGWRDPSEHARQPDLARTLWNDSARLVGLPS